MRLQNYIESHRAAKSQHIIITIRMIPDQTSWKRVSTYMYMCIYVYAYVYLLNARVYIYLKCIYILYILLTTLYTIYAMCICICILHCTILQHIICETKWQLSTLHSCPVFNLHNTLSLTIIISTCMRTYVCVYKIYSVEMYNILFRRDRE